MSSLPRSRTLVPLIIAAVVVVVLIVVTLVVRNRPVTSAAVEEAGVADERAGARPETGGLAASGLPRSRPPALSRQDAQALVRRNVERRREGRKANEKRAETLRTRVAAQFDAEKVDPAWAPGKQVDLEKISNQPQITSAIPPPKNMSVSCKSSMCRIDSAFDSNGSAEDWTMLYMASVGSSLPNAVVSRVQNPDGTTSVRIYGKGR